MKKEKTDYSNYFKEQVSLRCYNCNYEFKDEVGVNENINEICICPNCHQYTIELNLGKKWREIPSLNVLNVVGK